MKSNKTQPQILLEEVIGADGRRADFPSIAAQQEYWDKRDAEYEAYLNEEHANQQKENQ